MGAGILGQVSADVHGVELAFRGLRRSEERAERVLRGASRASSTGCGMWSLSSAAQHRAQEGLIWRHRFGTDRWPPVTAGLRWASTCCGLAGVVRMQTAKCMYQGLSIQLYKVKPDLRLYFPVPVAAQEGLPE